MLQHTTALMMHVVEAFYEDLEKAHKQCKSQEMRIIMGDFNGKVGKGKDGSIVGPHGLGD